MGEMDWRMPSALSLSKSRNASRLSSSTPDCTVKPDEPGGALNSGLRNGGVGRALTCLPVSVPPGSPDLSCGSPGAAGATPVAVTTEAREGCNSEARNAVAGVLFTKVGCMSALALGGAPLSESWKLNRASSRVGAARVRILTRSMAAASRCSSPCAARVALPSATARECPLRSPQWYAATLQRPTASINASIDTPLLAGAGLRAGGRTSGMVWVSVRKNRPGWPSKGKAQRQAHKLFGRPRMTVACPNALGNVPWTRSWVAWSGPPRAFREGAQGARAVAACCAWTARSSV
jgi:hypothetical protein